MLVALAVLYVPQNDNAEALAPLLRSIDPKGHNAANFKICLVHPEWRGHHLQVKLGNLLNNEARQRGFDLLCATASPHNIASIRSLQQLGYRADHAVQKYGFERIVFFHFN
jgi:GNAT superfamily N-acetyltransferase